HLDPSPGALLFGPEQGGAVTTPPDREDRRMFEEQETAGVSPGVHALDQRALQVPALEVADPTQPVGSYGAEGSAHLRGRRSAPGRRPRRVRSPLRELPAAARRTPPGGSSAPPRRASSTAAGTGRRSARRWSAGASRGRPRAAPPSLRRDQP